MILIDSCYEKKCRSFDLQKATNYVTIVGTCISLFFAGYAIYLTILLNETDETVYQLGKTNDNIILLITETKKSINKQDTTIFKLIEQNKIQNTELDLLRKDLKISLEKDRLEKTVMYIEYDKLMAEFKDSIVDKILFAHEEFLNMTNEDRTRIIKNIQAIISKIDYYTPIINVNEGEQNPFRNEWMKFKFFFNNFFYDEMTTDKWLPDDPAEKYERRKKKIEELNELYFKLQTDESFNKCEWQKINNIAP